MNGVQPGQKVRATIPNTPIVASTFSIVNHMHLQSPIILLLLNSDDAPAL